MAIQKIVQSPIDAIEVYNTPRKLDQKIAANKIE